MCKTCVDSEGVILNGFLKRTYLKETLMERETPPPFTENSIKILLFVLRNPSINRYYIVWGILSEGAGVVVSLESLVSALPYSTYD